MKKYLIIILLVSASTKVSAQAKTHENYKKTVAFIKSKTHDAQNGDLFFDLNINSCTLKVTVKNDNNSIRNTQTVSLKELNPNNIKVKVYGIQLYVKGSRNLVKVKFPGQDIRKSAMTEIISLEGNNNPERLSRAFKWLIEYCGGSDEMY